MLTEPGLPDGMPTVRCPNKAAHPAHLWPFEQGDGSLTEAYCPGRAQGIDDVGTLANGATLKAALMLAIDYAAWTGPMPPGVIRPAPTILDHLDLPVIQERPMALDPENLTVASLELHIDRHALAEALRAAADRIEAAE